MKQLGQFINEAKATYCGRCGTTHVPPAKGGTCPAVKEEVEELDEISSKTLSSYSKKAKKEAEKRDDPMHRSAGRLMASKKTNPARGGYKLTKVAATFGEEVEELDETAKIVAHLQKRYGDNIRKSHVTSAAKDFGVDASKLAKAVRKKLGKTMLDEEADKGIRIAKVMHKGKHVANVTTYRGRGGNWVSGAETPDGQNATKKYGIGMLDTKKEIMKKIKQHHMNEAVGDVTVKKVSAADQFKKLTGQATTKSKVPVDPKTGKTLYQKVTSEEVDQIDEVSAAKLRDYADKASDARGHRNLPTAKLDKRYKSMALAHEKIRQRHAMVPATEEKAKTLSKFIEEAVMNEAHDVELKPHSNGTHYIVHKIHPSSGIEKDQLKVGEKISDTHVDDLHDMGYSVKIHKK